MGRRSPGSGGLTLRVLSFGRDRSGLFAPAANEYAKRLMHYVPLELVELAAGRTPEEEADALFARVKEGERLVALDERGKPLTSPQLAGLLAEERLRSGRLTFVIGGDEGLAARVREKAGRVLQLSSFTLPHRLARVFLLEQLYRAFTLLRGEPYHK